MLSSYFVEIFFFLRLILLFTDDFLLFFRSILNCFFFIFRLELWTFWNVWNLFDILHSASLSYPNISSSPVSPQTCSYVANFWFICKLSDGQNSNYSLNSTFLKSLLSFISNIGNDSLLTACMTAPSLFATLLSISYSMSSLISLQVYWVAFSA